MIRHFVVVNKAGEIYGLTVYKNATEANISAKWCNENLTDEFTVAEVFIKRNDG